MRSRRNPRLTGLGVFALLWIASSSAWADEPTKPTPPASEKNPAIPAAGHSIHGEAFDEGPRRAATLMKGMGKVQFPVTTSKPDAQTFINQGVAQLHSYFYFEAERSFRQAAKLDPTCAMAYWGMAMANVNNSKRARGFLKEANQRKAGLSRREILYIEALEPLHKETGDDASRKKAHLAGLEILNQEFPDDIDGRAWLAMVIWQNGKITSRQGVDIVLETVLNQEPVHPGAHHYRIHLWDGEKPERATKSAAMFGNTAPGIAHAWHMPGHTYTGLKRYADAAYQQEASARVDHAYMMREHVMPFEIHNYAHNNQWLVTSLANIGRARDAVFVARNLVEQPRDPNLNGKNDGGSAQRSGRIRWAETLARFELWDDLIQATEIKAIDWSDVPLEQKEKAYFLGLAHAAKGNVDKVSEQLAKLKAIADEEAKAKRPVITEGAIAELEGLIHLAKGETGPAFDRLAKAGSSRSESLARYHLQARNYGFAEAKAKESVNSQPNQVAPLAALVEVLNACGKVKEAQEAYRKLEPLAKNADPDLPVLRRLAPSVNEWKADKAWPAKASEPITDDTTAQRVDLNTLGPLGWSPTAAEPLDATDTDGKAWTLAGRKGKNVIALFYLGGKCPHCMQQLQLFTKELDAFKGLNAEVVAISTDDLAASKSLKENKVGVVLSMPILADPKLEMFKRYGAYDDFDQQPLHGTFLIDRDGNVRYQRVSSEPFLDTDFMKAEVERVNRLLTDPRK